MKFKYAFTIACLFAVLTLTSAYAQDNWLGGTGNWSNGTFWSLGFPPPPSDNATIYSGGVDMVTLDLGSTAVNSLNLGGSIGYSEVTDGGTTQNLSVANGLNVGSTGVLYFYGNGSSLNLGGNVANNGSIVLSSATFILNTSGSLDNYATLYNVGTLNNSGTLNNHANAALYNSGTLNNNSILSSSGNFDNFGDVENYLTLNNSGTLNNHSHIQTVGDVNGHAVMNNSGMLNNYAFLLVVGVNLSGFGSAVLNNTGILNNYGSLDGFNGFAGGDAFVNNAGTLNNYGGFGLDGAYGENDGIFNNYGTTDLRPFFRASTFVNRGTFNNFGAVVVSASDYGQLFANASILNNNEGATLSNGTFDGMSNSNLLNNAGALNNGGSFGSTGTINNSGVINTGGLFSNFYSVGTINNSGTINTMHGRFYNGGMLNNYGIVNNYSYAQAFTNSGTFENHGTFNNNYVQGVMVYAFQNGGTFLNYGTVTNNSTFSNGGMVLIAPGAALFTFSLGSYEQSAGSTVVDGLFASNSVIQIDGGTMSGSGLIRGDVVMGGTMSPGDSPGVLTMQGNYTQLPGGTFLAEIAGLAPGTQYDQLLVSGTAALDGTLDVDLLNGFVVQVGDSFVLMTFGSESGQFSTLDLPTLPRYEQWLLSYSANDLTLSVLGTPTPEPASFLLLGSGLLGALGAFRRKSNL